MNSTVIARTVAMKDLGVTFDQKLTFHDHIAIVAKESFQRLGFVLRNSRDFKSKHVIRLLFSALVRSKLEASACVWNPHESTYKLLLEKVQKAFLRYLYKRNLGYYPFMYPTKFLQGCLNFNSLETRRANDQIVTVCKILRGLIDAPDLHNELARFYTPNNYRGSRRHKLFAVPSCRTVARSNSPLPRTLAALNALLHANPDIDLFADGWKKILMIGWRTTNAWLAGNVACKFFLVLRAFGLYLSSNVLVCISVDRFFAIIYPLRLHIARKRSKMMLSIAWLVALLCSLPQSLVFRVMQHPQVRDFEQCVSFEAFSSQSHELAYNVFCLCGMYFLPLVVISVCYLCIFYKIYNNSKENSEKYQQSNHSKVMLRRSDQRPLARARRRTLRMTITIVTVFACCWLPYATMTLWYMIDRKSAVHVSTRLQDLFFIMAVSNSCMDPLVYGTFTIDPRTFTKTFRKIFCIHNRPLEIPKINQPSTINEKISINGDLGHQNNNVRKGQFSVYFDNCSTVRPSVNSDPIQFWSERSNDGIMKQAHSCDVFMLHTPPKTTFRS